MNIITRMNIKANVITCIRVQSVFFSKALHKTPPYPPHSKPIFQPCFLCSIELTNNIMLFSVYRPLFVRCNTCDNFIFYEIVFFLTGFVFFFYWISLKNLHCICFRLVWTRRFMSKWFLEKNYQSHAWFSRFVAKLINFKTSEMS